ncbi:MAG TPA: hypothetical protein VF250_00935 [Conexibacter sp.]
MRVGRTLLAIVGATVLFGALATAASARNLSTSNQQIRAQWREVRFSGLFGTATCQITVEGSFHERTTAKVVGRLVGYIFRVRLGPCASGTATILTETLPWHVTYAEFSGTLPNITAINAKATNVSFTVRTPEGFNCLARSTAEAPVIGNFIRDIATGAITGSNVGGGGGGGGEGIPTSCGLNGSFNSDRGIVRLTTSGATLIFITLI